MHPPGEPANNNNDWRSREEESGESPEHRRASTPEYKSMEERLERHHLSVHSVLGYTEMKPFVVSTASVCVCVCVKERKKTKKQKLFRKNKLCFKRGVSILFSFS